MGPSLWGCRTQVGYINFVILCQISDSNQWCYNVFAHEKLSPPRGIYACISFLFAIAEFLVWYYAEF